MQGFRSRTLLLFLMLSLCTSAALLAQININANQTAAAMINRLVGVGITYTNPQLTCPNNASGKFDNGMASSILIDSGIVLTTGRAATSGTAYGVNGLASDFASVNNNTNGGDANLAAAANTTTNNIHDLCKLEFDFIPTGDTIQFNYRFGSEEYPTYNCSNYNDIFAFFLSGPGYAAPTNVALVPGTTIPVTINSINNGTISAAGGGNLANCTNMGAGSPFTSLYVNNTSSTTITYNGLTAILTAKAAVTPCSTYHMKFAIADVQDHQYDSGVFLKAGSFTSDLATVTSVTSSNTLGGSTPFAIEGCSPAVITISRPQPKPYAQVVTYTLGGSATNGVDVTTLSGSATIPANGTSTTITVNALADGLVEGTETLIFNINGSLCGNSVTETLTMNIMDYPTYQKPVDDTLCFGQSATLTVTPVPANLNLGFSWSPSAVLSSGTGTSVTASPLSTTTFTITSSYPGCPPVDSTVTLTVDPQVNLVLTPVAVTCNGQSNGSISASTTASSPFTMTLNPGAVITNVSPHTFSNLNAGSYTITASSSAGCTLSSTTVVTQPAALQWGPIQTVNPLCSGSTNGSIQSSVSGGSGSLSYTLFPGNTTNSSGQFSGLSAAVYTLQVTDANGCTASTIVNLNASLAVTFTNVIVSNITPCYGGQNGSIQVSASGGTGTLGYHLNPTNINAASGNFPGLSAGNYTVIVTDANGCSNTTAMQVNQPAQVLITSVQNTPPLCNGQANGSIQVNASGGSGSLQFTLIPGNVSSASGSFSGLAANTYTIVVSDANTCTATTVSTLTQASAIQWVTTSFTPVGCNGQSNGAILANASGGSGGLQYNLMPGNVSNASGSFNGLAANVYTITVSDANNCTATTLLTLIDPNPLSWNLVNTINILPCNGNNTGQIQVVANGGSGTLTYTLVPSGGSNNSGQFNALAAGSYSATATDAHGCTLTTLLQLTQPSAVGFTNVSNTPVLCNGGNTGSINAQALGGSGSIHYVLMPGNTTTTTGQFSNLIAGLYTVTAYDANNCTAATSVNITQPAAMQFSVFLLTSVSCNGGNNGSINASVSGGSGLPQYTLQPTGSTNSNGNFTALNAGTYTLQVSDANACTLSTIAVITQPTTLQWNAPVITQVSCNGGTNGTIHISGTGGSGTLTYHLQPGNLVNTNGQFNALMAGTYTITMVDANACTSSTLISITQPAALIYSSFNVVHPSCLNTANGSLQLSGSGGTPAYSYAVNGGAYSSLNTFSNLLPGQYTVHVKDANACIHDSIVNLTPLYQLQWNNVILTQVPCKFQTNGSISLTTSGGTAPYQYHMNGGTWQPNGQFNALPAGIYTLQVADSNGCLKDTTLSITEPLQVLSISTLILTDILCYGDASGQIQGSASGGTAPYSYSIDGINWQNTGTFSNLTAGIFTFHIKDSHGCLHDTIVTLSQPGNALVLQLQHSKDVSCSGVSDGGLWTSASGGVAPYLFSINGSAQVADSSFQNLNPGLYHIVVTDQHGCTSSIDVPVNLSTRVPAIVIQQITEDVCKDDASGMINWDAVNSNPPNHYTFNGVYLDTTSIKSQLNSGTYTIELQDAIGCRADTTLTIQSSNTLQASVLTTAATCAGKGYDGKAEAVVQGGIMPYNYLWLGSAGSLATISQLAFGTHTLVVSDDIRCTDTVTYTIDYTPCCLLSMPNAFSPNGDGKNDVFHPLAYGNINLKSMEIFDRWGKRVFVGYSLHDSWDGTYSGTEEELGTYFYLVKYYCEWSDELHILKGDFTLIR